MARHGCAWFVLLALGLGAACKNAGEDRVLAIEAVGNVSGIVFLDGDGSEAADSDNDDALPDVQVSIVLRGTRDTVGRARTDEDGVFTFDPLPVGTYELVVDTVEFADSIAVIPESLEELALGPGDTAQVTIAVGYPMLTVAEARAHPLGKRVFVTGVALNAVGTFGDTTLSLVDTSGTVRAARVRPSNIGTGDSVRVRGVTATQEGQRVLDDARAFFVDFGSVPPAESLSTSAAATADGGRLDAALVQIAGATLVDSMTVGDDLHVTVDDGSGPLAVALDEDVPFALGPFALPGALVDAFGILTPAPGGTWRLKPRGDPDLDVTVNVTDIRAIRMLPVGQRVFLDGVAMNALDAFGDSTVHVSDSTGALRVIRVARVSVFAGDLVRFAGAVATRDGQPVLDDVTTFVLGGGTVPNPRMISTAVAASADGGNLDAALVEVMSANVTDTGSVTGGFELTVDDGSGSVIVLLDGDVGFDPSQYPPGATLDVTGLLVPDGTGSWVLKPRVVADLTVQ